MLSYLGDQFALLDSGSEKRVEKYGDTIVIRPHKRACWSLAQPINKWHKIADAEFDTEIGAWKSLSSNKPESWLFDTPFGTLNLRLQSSNQVGLFPEHLTYFQHLANVCKSENPRVLNLFAYTGAATLFSLNILKGQEVIHVDTSKNCLTWTKENLALNNFSNHNCRLIPEDALLFVQKMLKRNEQFDLIIADPPSFSRAKNQQWSVQSIIENLINDLINLLAEKGVLLLTSHALELDHHTLSNIANTTSKHLNATITSDDLILSEANRRVKIKCGDWVCLVKN
jgi:23S rRNA (cytosine1962-C5)-methyltransferase